MVQFIVITKGAERVAEVAARFTLDAMPEIENSRASEMFMVIIRIMTDSPMFTTSKADVVIRNPTHYAVALRYHPDEDAAPIVLAKGR